MWYKCKEEVLWKRHIDHIKPLISESPSLPPVIPLKDGNLLCVTDLPPVKLTNLGQDTTEGATPPTETTLTQDPVPSLLQTLPPNLAESAPLPVAVPHNPNTPRRMEGQGRIPSVPASTSVDLPTLAPVPQKVTMGAPTPQRPYPARNRRPPDRF